MAEPSLPPPGEPRWWVLIHQIPPRPLYLRARIRQQLARVGAVALKNSVYLLPRNEVALEDFEWIAQEAVAGGGEAFLCEAEFVGRVRGDELVQRFRRERAADWGALASVISVTLGNAARPKHADADREDLGARSRKLRRRFDELVSIDFFEAPGRDRAATLLDRLERRVTPHPTPPTHPGAATPWTDLIRRVWVTRRGVHVDRIASAWLVRKFIDPDARFRFVDPKDPAAKPGEIRFDVVGGDFTHGGDRCTFETMIQTLALRDPALEEVAQIVHDIDLKDGKFGRSDAAGIRQLLAGLVLAHSDDLDRLDRGFALFDDLYQSFCKRSSSTGSESAPPQEVKAPSRRRRRRRNGLSKVATK